jgi:hypothetical protein
LLKDTSCRRLPRSTSDNGLDVEAFAEVLLSGPYQPEADMNEDEVVNGLDVDPFVATVVGGAQSIPEPSTLLFASAPWALSADGGSGARETHR